MDASRDPRSSLAEPRKHVERIVDYYTQAGPDYSQWSKQFNMHFGFYRWGMNPFDLEGMLERMNYEVLRLLALGPRVPQRILDLGCGLGATLRYAAASLPSVRAYGLTLVPWQAQQALELSSHETASARTAFVVGDYTATPFPAESFDGVYALESSCYAPGESKESLLREAWRVLKPGGTLVIADAFLKARRRMAPWTSACYRALCKCWSLETLGDLQKFTACARSMGFTDLVLENISKNVTPSVLHVPVVAARFGIKELLLNRSKLSSKRWGHLVAGILLIAFTLDRTRSGYFMISARKPR